MNRKKLFLERECVALAALFDPAFSHFQTTSRARRRFAAAAQSRASFCEWRKAQRFNGWWPVEGSQDGNVHGGVDPYLFARAYTGLAAELSSWIEAAGGSALEWTQVRAIPLPTGFDPEQRRQLDSVRVALLDELFQIYRLVREARSRTSSNIDLISLPEQTAVLQGDLLTPYRHNDGRTVHVGLPCLARSRGLVVGVSETGFAASIDMTDASGRVYPLFVSVYRLDNPASNDLALSHYPSFLTAQECLSSVQKRRCAGWWGAVEWAFALARERFQAIQQQALPTLAPLSGHLALKWHIDFGRGSQYWHCQQPCNQAFGGSSHGVALCRAMVHALTVAWLMQPQLDYTSAD